MSYKKRNTNKFYVEYRNVLSNHYKQEKPIKMLVAADIHFHPNVDKEIYYLLIENAKFYEPDFIIMPGDLIETNEFFEHKHEKRFLCYLIKSLSEIAPVIIVPGNHEIEIAPYKNMKRPSNKYNEVAIKFFEGLNKYDNVYFLNNEQINLKGIEFLGFSPSAITYKKKNDKKVNDIFIDEFNNSGFKMDENNYNVLITHSTMLLFNEYVFNSIPEFKNCTDLVIGGHFHDGYLPKFLDKRFGNTNAGLTFTPFLAKDIVSRGLHEFGRGHLFVSQGFRKFTYDIKIFNLFEKITANDIENIIIANSDLTKLNSESFQKVLKR